MFALSLWFIWKQRCSILFQDDGQIPVLNVQQLYKYFTEWATENSNSLQRIRENGSHILWRRPELGYFKLNTDASSLPDGRMAIGGVVRDHNGQWKVGFMQVLPKMSVFEVEARSIMVGLSLLQHHQVPKLIIESDSLKAVDLIQHQVPMCHPLLMVWASCYKLLTRYRDWQIQHVYREANKVAHLLVTMAKRSTQGLHVLYHAPNQLCNILLTEAVTDMQLLLLIYKAWPPFNQKKKRKAAMLEPTQPLIRPN